MQTDRRTSCFQRLLKRQAEVLAVSASATIGLLLEGFEGSDSFMLLSARLRDVTVGQPRPWTERPSLAVDSSKADLYVLLALKRTGEHCFAQQDRAPISHEKRWHGGEEPSTAARELWAQRAKAGEFDKVTIPLSCYVPVGNDTASEAKIDALVTEDPRVTQSYWEHCLDGLLLPRPSAPLADEHRGAHPDLLDIEIQALADLMQRKACALWVEGTPQTTVRGFLHDVVVKGGPISLAPIVRAGEAADWVEEKLRADHKRGQLVYGNSAWGSPAFRVQAKGR